MYGHKRRRVWDKTCCMEQGHFMLHFTTFYHVSMYMKWAQKLVMRSAILAKFLKLNLKALRILRCVSFRPCSYTSWCIFMSYTRMHSSRMRTGRSLTICRSLLPGGDVCYQGRGGGSAPGVVVSAPGGSSAPRGAPEGGVCSGGWCSGGWCLLPGGSVHAGIPDPPPCEQNDKQVQKYYVGHNFVAAGKNQ